MKKNCIYVQLFLEIYGHQKIRRHSSVIFNSLQFQSKVRITLDGESTSTSNDTTTTTGHITFTLFDRNILILLCMLLVFLAIVSLIGLVLARMMQTPPQMVKYWDNRLLEAFRTNLATQE